MKRFRVRKSGPLRGEIRVPGDKSIGHRALIFAALSNGECTVRGLSGGLDNQATANAFAAMGVRIHDYKSEVRVRGVGLSGLSMPQQPIDCGNSGTTLRMLAGLLCAQKFGTRLIGDHSLQRRPMRRIIEPLRARGAHIAGVSGAKPNEVYPPLSIAPLLENEMLTGIEYEMPVASAQVKSALLLSGLYAKDLTAIKEPVLSRDHTERMLMALGVPLRAAGTLVMLDPSEWNGQWNAFEWDVPSDFSSAAFFIAAAMLVPQSELTIRDVGINPTRTGLIDAVRAMGRGVFIRPQGETAGEPMGEITLEHASLRGGLIAGELVTRMIDEVPAFAAIAAVANGVTEVRDAKELRVKESDRIATMTHVLRAFGVDCDERDDGMVIRGPATLKAAHVESYNDHRIAMAATILGLAAEGETVVDDVECVDTSFPGFANLLRQLGATINEDVL